MKYATIFSGIEAPSVAWKSLKWEPQFFAEIDPFCCALLEQKFPGVPNLGDAEKIHKHEAFKKSKGKIDLLIGGSPCQSFSVAGKRLGLDDARGNLALVYLRIVRELRPRWFIFENVPGLLSSAKGWDFGTLIRAVAKLGNYGCAWRILDAQYYGVPQRRSRIILVGYSGGDWRPSAAVLFESESLQGNTAKGGRKRKNNSRTVENGTGNYCQIIEGDSAASTPKLPRLRVGCGRGGETAFIEVKNTVCALTANGVGTCGADDNQAQAGHIISVTGDKSHALTAEGSDASEDGTGRGTPIISFQQIVAFKESQSGVRLDDVHLTIDANKGSRRQEGILETWPDKSMPVMARDYKGPRNYRDGGLQGTAVIDTRPRRLTPLECERLQGLPDNWTKIPHRGKPAEKCADSPRYRAIGNSMAVPVIHWVGARIAAVDRMVHNK